ncbi:hypothetical protein AQUCO_04200096v1 [Aquilegia coerulea]|uniref:Prolamin-like domain-containing protein n=1 Tax=Aquilegia coerulea TaxID=218851 RepID=A0A2G5CP78_AQUCA|nr:hypothetical protein AQUCO_04200096v1 [Aquilegia coerulea]
MMIKIPGMVTVSMATVLKVVCVTMLMIIPTRAQLQPPSFGMIPPFNQELADPNAGKRLASFQTTQGCTQEIITSFFRFQVRQLSPSRCKALIAIDNNCWPKLFPFNPFFPSLLKTYCSAKANSSPSPHNLGTTS